MAPAGSLSVAQARRIALRAQGLDTPRPTGRVDRRHIRRVVDTLGLIQIDSVNVLARTQYLTLFSRLGPYDTALFDTVAYRDNELFEYWGHVASLVSTRFHPHLRWRMRDDHDWGSLATMGREHPELVRSLEEEILRRGPWSAGELNDSGHRKGPWWGWGDTKRALEYLFWSGRVGALRRGNFERIYCAPDQAVPREVLDLPEPDRDSAHRTLLLHAARMHGVGTARDLADVWRQPVRLARRHLDDLANEGSLARVSVEGWRDDAYLSPDVTLPRRVEACALVSPFDSAMWERDRIERLHDFRYRIEIYVPKPKRVHGYYVLPFLLGDTYVARVDLKADRAGGRLLVQSAHAEPDLASRGTDEVEVAERLRDELRTMAAWIGLDDVHVVGRGDLSPALAAVST
ncbi:winged helix-turn-helix domain-containing protein [Actinospongicola halichondriae]|uniref:winged helix-turn-helix domain-containing protein n=1 Tax=Actinospongicola halichondriae TaxID=3236844 RepID=UPI003D4E1074